MFEHEKKIEAFWYHQTSSALQIKIAFSGRWEAPLNISKTKPSPEHPMTPEGSPKPSSLPPHVPPSGEIDF